MFKKILLGIAIIVFLASSAFAQTITENLDAMDTELKQALDLMSARDILENTYRIAKNRNAEIQALVDGGQFDQIPLNVKQALNQAWTALKNYIAVLEGNADIMETFEWGD